MSQTLLLVSIGPVQVFIAAARKLRDLWFGSWVLSELSKTVARCLHENGAKLVFPATTDAASLKEGSSFNVANKIMALVNSGDEAERLQKLARQAWRAHLDGLSEKALQEMKKSFKGIKIDEERFRKQQSDYGEYFAVWVDVEANGGYDKSRKQAESLLASRKNIREFRPPGWEGAGIPKNSLDGAREAVTLEGCDEITGILKKNEKLDSMGCIKRFCPLADGHTRKHFDDLADIALRPWLEGIGQSDESRQLLLAFQGILTDDKNLRPGGWEISSAVQKMVLSELYYAQKLELEEVLGREKGGRAWSERTKLVRKCGEPSPYAAILVADGDRMGQMIDDIGTVEGHRAFSSALSDFAAGVSKAVEDAGGGMIYSGGDDVMAYVPIHRAVDCADQLRTSFRAAMEKIHGQFKLKCEVPTLSAGLAIIHHSLPLDQALGLAREAERTAKNRGGRNALAIVLSKRSGDDITVCGKWDSQGELPGIAERARQIVRLCNATEPLLPAQLGYHLRQARLAAGDAMAFSTKDGQVEPKNAAAALALRIFQHRNEGDAEKNRKLMPLLAGRQSVIDLSDELIVLRQIAQSCATAEGKELK